LPSLAEPIGVLLVDDQDAYRDAIAVIVDADPNLRVVGSVADGASGVAAARDVRPDVILMDIRMPIMDGVEATRRILAERPETKIIVLTTFNLDDRAATAIRHGACGFLLKQCTPSQLTGAVHTVHDGNAVLAPGDLGTLLAGSFAAAESLPPSYAHLTDRERDMVGLLARGLSNAEIAGELFVEESTVKSHVGAVLRKLELRDRVQVVVFAHRHGLA